MRQLEPPSFGSSVYAVAREGERRRAPRESGSAPVYLLMGGVAAKARLEDHSGGGMRIRSRAALKLGDILYCASPSLAVCTRARVVHVKRGLLQKTAGLEYLATLSDFG